jgi:cystathionine beta-lyase/cystathionine gamma-synthase
VQFLKQHPKVDSVIFPFDEDFPQYGLARQQMSGACGLFTFILKPNRREDIVRFCESLEHILMAVSWGGHESLVIPKCAGILPADYDPANRSHRYIRMYAGLEEYSYLRADLEQALAKL